MSANCEEAFITPVTKFLDSIGAHYIRHTADADDLVGRESLCASLSRQLSIPLSSCLKTLIFEDSVDKAAHPIALVLPGNRSVDKTSLLKAAGFPPDHKLRLCKPERAHSYTGYVFGGTAPFGMVRMADVRVFVDCHVAENPIIYVNGGGRGLVVEMTYDDFASAIRTNGGFILTQEHSDVSQLE